MRQNWPERLWLVRHGQSQGNVARDAAHEAGLHEIDITVRDVDVPLSELGLRQAEAAGRWFAALPEDQRPEIILSSPYLRARQTAEAICTAGALAGGPARTIVDERLREREFGVFDRLTTLGIRDKYPEEAAHRAKLGKFYHRPPGGESWADVILRLPLDAQHHQPAPLRPARAGGRSPGRRPVHALHFGRAGRDRNPGHRPPGRGPQLRHLRL
jgi:broad specificity phosphatase PhoE